MKPLILSAIFALLFNVSFAQNEPGIFAVTDQLKTGTAWNTLRTIQSGTAATNEIISNKSVSKALVNQPQLKLPKKPLCTGVAALAFDAATQQLFYVTMMSGDLRIVATGKNAEPGIKVATNLYNQLNTDVPLIVGPQHQGAIITRLTASPNGYIYGLSNDASLFFRFHPAQPQTIEQLKPVVAKDEISSNNLSLPQNWGGDMVADANGDFYVFTQLGKVFKIQTLTASAQLMGEISNLPQQFSISGAAATAQGQILLSSSEGEGRFATIKSIEKLIATPKANGSGYNAGDLASAYFIGEALPQAKAVVAGFQAYPNPVTGSQVTVKLDSQSPAGSFQVELIALNGARSKMQMVQVSEKDQAFTLNTRDVQAGMYLLKVSHQQQAWTHSQKLLVQ